MNEPIKMYVAGSWFQGKFMPIVFILKYGGIFKVKSNIEMHKDNHGHLTLKINKFFKDKSTVKEGETTDITNLIKELRDAGFEVIELHEFEKARDINISSSIPASGFNFPATI